MQLLHAESKAAALKLDCAGELLGVLPPMMRFVRRQMRSRRAAGLSIPQFRTLVQLYHRPSACLSTIAEALGTSAPATSRMVSGLVRKGFVSRQTSPKDRRQVTLELTAKGRTVMRGAWMGTQQVIAEQFASLSARQLDELRRSLGVLSSLFGSIGEMPADRTPSPAADGRPRRRLAKTRSPR